MSREITCYYIRLNELEFSAIHNELVRDGDFNAAVSQLLVIFIPRERIIDAPRNALKCVKILVQLNCFKFSNAPQLGPTVAPYPAFGLSYDILD